MVLTQPTHHHRLNYAVDHSEASLAFWASKHEDNRAKAIIAFSYDEENAMLNLRRWEGSPYPFSVRKAIWNTYGLYVNTPAMDGIPFSVLGVNEELELPYAAPYPPELIITPEANNPGVEDIPGVHYI
jgi:hypothetical protein